MNDCELCIYCPERIALIREGACDVVMRIETHYCALEDEYIPISKNKACKKFEM